jgi:hypothetical protein
MIFRIARPGRVEKTHRRTSYSGEKIPEGIILHFAPDHKTPAYWNDNDSDAANLGTIWERLYDIIIILDSAWRESVKLPQHLCYRAYILRLWQERPASPAHPAVWRFSVEDPRTGQRQGFGSLEKLTAYLQARMEAGEQGSRGEEVTR